VYFRTKTIKGTPLLQLVQSFRNDEGQPRQRIIASLGDAQLPEDEKKQIAKAVQLRLQGQEDWFDSDILSEDGAAWVARIAQIAQRSKSANPVDSATIDGVILDQVETENIVQLGPQLVASKAWDELNLTPILEDLGMNSSAIATAQLMIFNRLIEPLSEWALIDWSHRTVLPEMLGIRITKTTKNRLYNTSDQLIKHRKTIEANLRTHEAQLFSSNRSVILYDVTNSHFEGDCQKNPKAKHGKNKQKRNDCKQVAVGVAFDEKGIPLVHDVFEGNMADAKTLFDVLGRLTEGCGKSTEANDAKPIVILDAGFASKENISLLKEKGFSYLINITRSNRTKYADSFKNETFEPVPGRKAEKKVEVKTIDDPDDVDSQLVLCRSAQRRLKEEAMLSKAEQRFLKDCEALKSRIEKGGLKKTEAIERSIGRLQKKHPRVNRYYTLTHEKTSLTIERKDDKFELATELCGDYVLKTDKSLGAVEIWQMYMTLLKAEAGFKMLKSALGLRPNFHQLEERVEGHIFISILAYHLLSWIRERFGQSGDSREWPTIRQLLRTHSVVTTRLPTTSGEIITVRKPSLPDAEQERVYQILGIDWRNQIPVTKSVRNSK
jgi:transposase